MKEYCDGTKDFYQVIPRGYPLPCDGAEERKLKPSEKVAKAVRVIEPKVVKVAKPQGSLVAERVANIEKKTAKAKEKEVQPKKAVGRPKKERKKVTLVDDGTDLFASLVARANEDEEEDDLGDEDAKLMLTDYEAWKRKNLGSKKSGKGLENKISTNNKMPNKWISYVKEYASKNGMNYRDALKDPKCKAGYKTGGMLETMGHQSRLLAHSFNDSELGANAGKKYISL
jgi:predicted DNA binding CopG/RHH family protein